MSDHDTLLLQRLAQTGDAEAFSAIITQYAGMVFATCRRVLRNETAASDAAQETFFHLLKSAHRITGSLGSWLHRVAVNRSLDLLREDAARRQREAAYSAQTWQETNQWEDIAPAVDEALEDLQPDERDLLIRHFLQAQSMVQIAAAEGVSQPTVSRRVAAALERLRDELRRRGVLVGLAALGGMLPLTAEAAPELLLHGLGNMVLGQAASASAAAAAGAGGYAAKLGSVLAAAVGTSLKLKFATLAIVVAAGTGVAIAHRNAQTPSLSAAPSDTPPTVPDERRTPASAQSPLFSPRSFASDIESPGRMAAVANARPLLQLAHAEKLSTVGDLAQLIPPGRNTGGSNFSGSGNGGNRTTNFSYSERRQFGDTNGGGTSGGGGGGGGGTYIGLGGRGSPLRMVAQTEVQKALTLNPEQKEAVKTIIQTVRAFEEKMLAEIRRTPTRSRSALRVAKFAEAERMIADARQELGRVLSPAQMQRLEQVSLQDAGAEALSQPAVAQALGLSRQQQQRLDQIRADANEQVAALHGRGSLAATPPTKSVAEIAQECERRMLQEVLTPQQQVRLKELQGEPFAFRPGYRPMTSFSGGGGGGSGGGSGGIR